MKKHLATITIFSADRHKNSVELQKILTENSNLIMARLGVNPSRMCSSKCPGLIILAVEGQIKEINSLTKKIDALYAIKAKSVIIA